MDWIDAISRHSFFRLFFPHSRLRLGSGRDFSDLVNSPVKSGGGRCTRIRRQAIQRRTRTGGTDRAQCGRGPASTGAHLPRRYANRCIAWPGCGCGERWRPCAHHKVIGSHYATSIRQGGSCGRWWYRRPRHLGPADPQSVVQLLHLMYRYQTN